MVIVGPAIVVVPLTTLIPDWEVGEPEDSRIPVVEEVNVMAEAISPTVKVGAYKVVVPAVRLIPEAAVLVDPDRVIPLVPEVKDI